MVEGFFISKKHDNMRQKYSSVSTTHLSFLWTVFLSTTWPDFCCSSPNCQHPCGRLRRLIERAYAGWVTMAENAIIDRNVAFWFISFICSDPSPNWWWLWNWLFLHHLPPPPPPPVRSTTSRLTCPTTRHASTFPSTHSDQRGHPSKAFTCLLTSLRKKMLLDLLLNKNWFPVSSLPWAVQQKHCVLGWFE